MSHVDLPLLVVDGFELRDARPSDVVDEDVQPAESRRGPRNRLQRTVGGCEIGLHADDPIDPHVGVAGGHGDGRAFACKQLRGLQSNATTAAGDEGSHTGEFQVHVGGCYSAV